MKSHDEKQSNILFETFSFDLNKVNSQLNHGLRHHNKFTKFILSSGHYLPYDSKQFNVNFLKVSPINQYDFGFRSWLKVVFFPNTMRINVPSNLASHSVNNNDNKLSNNGDRITEFTYTVDKQLPPRLNTYSESDQSCNRLTSSLVNSLDSNNSPLMSKEPILISPVTQPQISTYSSIYNKSVFLITNDYAWSKHLLAGATAGVASRTCTAPLDRIKVLLQVKSSEIPTITVRSCFKFIKEEGGYRAFWRGNGINCIKIAPEIAFRFMFYEQFKRYIKGDSDRQLAIYERLLSGSLAGSLSQSIIYPLEVIKTRFCLRKTGQYNGIFDAVKRIYRIEGYRTFYRGFCVNLAGILPYSGIDLTVYETLKNFYLGHFQNEDPSVLIVLICGITSNISGQCFSYPLALVRTRLQAMNDSKIGFNTIRKEIYNTYGMIGFYRGFIPNLIKVAPANAITYIVYEQIRQFLNVKMS